MRQLLAVMITLTMFASDDAFSRRGGESEGAIVVHGYLVQTDETSVQPLPATGRRVSDTGSSRSATLPTANTAPDYSALREGPSPRAAKNPRIPAEQPRIALTSEERAALDAACQPTSQDRPSPTCERVQLSQLENAPFRPDLSQFSRETRHLVSSACTDALRSGPAIYNDCLYLALQVYLSKAISR